MKNHSICKLFQSFSRAAMTAVFLLFLAGCGPDPAPPPIRVSVSYWIGYEPFFVAEGMNFFPEGSVHLVENIDAVSLAQTIQGNTIDAIAISLSRALTYVEAHQDVTIVLVLGWSNGADKLLAVPTITSIKDLKGKRIGTETGTVNTYLLLRALQKNGLSLKDVDIVPLKNETMNEYFLSENLAAASVYGRAVAKIEQLGARSIFDSSMIPGEIMDVLLVRTPFLRDYPERVEALIKGWMKAVDYMNGLTPQSNFVPFLMEKEHFKKNIGLSKYASENDNEMFLKNDWENLKKVIERRREAERLLSSEKNANLLPALDNSSFYKAKTNKNRMRVE